jgi:broad specificity phosphatase PhoE
MRLILIRHGESHHTYEGVIAELSGCRGLTDRGYAQVHSLADRLRTNGEIRDSCILMSSPVLRAQQTAAILAEATSLGPVVQERDLCEIHPGLADGLTWEAYRTVYGTFDLVSSPLRYFAPGGESWVQFLDRVRATVGRLAAQFADQTVVAVTHAGFIVASILVLFDIPRPGTTARLDPEHTAITEWDNSDGVWRLVRFNDMGHWLEHTQ